MIVAPCLKGDVEDRRLFDVWNPIIRLRGVREPNGAQLMQPLHTRLRATRIAQRESVVVIIAVNH